MAFKTFPTKNLANSNGGSTSTLTTVLVLLGIIGLGYLFKTQVLDKNDKDDKQ